MRGSFLRPLGPVLCLCLLYGAAAVSAQEEPLQASRNGEALALVPAEGSARLELPGGRSLRLTLPDRAELSSLAALDGGWAVAGSYPDATGGRRLFLLRGDDKAARPLPEPAGQVGAERSGPVLLVDNGRLAGLAWLEGDDRQSLSVRAAAWTGRRWEAPQQVSHPGPGSQLALAGAVLTDGSWLLAWSAFDGTADEIIWSRRVGGSWLPVSRLSSRNAVPDITPALTATAAGGALVAWSRYDGRSYQLRAARFEAGEWRGERAAGPSGSLYPTFVGDAGRVRLLYMDAVPRAWSVVELDGEGRAVAKATVLSALDRPVVSFEENGAVRMRWPSRKRQAAAQMDKIP